jgi:hypothetical protein
MPMTLRLFHPILAAPAGYAQYFGGYQQSEVLPGKKEDKNERHWSQRH